MRIFPLSLSNFLLLFSLFIFIDFSLRSSRQQQAATDRESFLLSVKNVNHRSIHPYIHTVIGLDSTTVSESLN